MKWATIDISAMECRCIPEYHFDLILYCFLYKISFKKGLIENIYFRFYLIYKNIKIYY